MKAAVTSAAPPAAATAAVMAHQFNDQDAVGTGTTTTKEYNMAAPASASLSGLGGGAVKANQGLAGAANKRKIAVTGQTNGEHQPAAPQSSRNLGVEGLQLLSAGSASSAGVVRHQHQHEEKREDEKQVRFGSEKNHQATNSSKGSLNTASPAAASRQTTSAASPAVQPPPGGRRPQHRYVSPGRPMIAQTNNSGMDSGSQDPIVRLASAEDDEGENDDPASKTFRSPARSGNEEASAALVSTYSSLPLSAASSFKTAPAASISVDHSSALGAADSPLGQASTTGKHPPPSAEKSVGGLVGKADKNEGKGSPGFSPKQAAAAIGLPRTGADSGYHLPAPCSPKSSTFSRMKLDEKKGDDDFVSDKELEHHAKKMSEVDDFVPHTPRSNVRDTEVTTPTDFTVDYGKGSSLSGPAFDTSNVLAWLQSPTAHGLFSPGGGLGSLMNTPAGGGAPPTPRTPTVSTSFFFSDVAGLPKQDGLSPKPDGGTKRKKGGISNIICISPLASTRGRNGPPEAAGTPLDFKDIFASPTERKSRNKGARGDPSLDAALAERDLLEDEDLSVLLQLASNTPSSKHMGCDGADSAVFRSPAGTRKADSDNFPGLELPMIGNNDNKDGKAKLQQKPGGSDRMMDGDTFGPPQLGMRSSSSHGSKEIKSKPSNVGSKEKDQSSDSKDKSSAAPLKCGSSGNTNSSLTNGTPYPMGPPYPPVPGDMHSFYPMSGMAPNKTGSMRVVVGGPPRRHNNGKQTGSPPRPGGSPPPHAPYYEYPPPPAGNMPYPPPPPGMFPSSYAEYNGMGRYPPYSHYPPPPPHNMPMYNAQHQSGGLKDPKKNKTSPKGGPKPAQNKRASLPDPDPKASPVKSAKLGAVAPSPNKKQKKTPSPSKKKRSPSLSDRAEREKVVTTAQAVNQVISGNANRAPALAAAILRGVTMRPSGKWQAQLYFAGKSRYIGVFDTREKAALAYEIAREKLKSGPQEGGALTAKSTENLVNAARKAAFDGVNERLPK